MVAAMKMFMLRLRSMSFFKSFSIMVSFIQMLVSSMVFDFLANKCFSCGLCGVFTGSVMEFVAILKLPTL